jgi:probable lipoprotein NlpC
MANSLAGPDMGMPIWRRESLQRGDIVFLYNTYGNFPEGTITHVGIYAGEGAYIHRPTSDRPVTHSALNGRFAGALRLSESICKN